MPLASIPEPGQAAWHFGPLTLRAYALCVIVGIAVAVAFTSYRYRSHGGKPGFILDVAAWAIPFGLIGAFLHAVLMETRHDFVHEPDLWRAATSAIAAIGVPGAIALGALGAWIACRRASTPLAPVAHAAAPGVAFGLAIGGLAHWWAEDFYGRPATFWLAERIGPPHRVAGFESNPTFQPAFLYQSLWDVAVGLVAMWAAKRFTLSGARVFLLAAAAYAAGGLWVESIRIGPLPRLFGMPYGAWGDVAVIVGAIAVIYLTRPRPKGGPPRPYGPRETRSRADQAVL
ncbi:MAG TPA: prolipoprotein diacylglyceryl transferase family protein [Streptosporangiaceae bacterium]